MNMVHRWRSINDDEVNSREQLTLLDFPEVSQPRCACGRLVARLRNAEIGILIDMARGETRAA
jgi:hypothetical protein